ncbi:transcription factor kayak isoform X2 [Bacillus rossius redtenbacheri]|uniref:transcription factor kayak isoform X2 n=1 Tax=Bacillus rossius redtenbacheri TaxID=93214 RepID=UPI002FDD2E99
MSQLVPIGPFVLDNFDDNIYTMYSDLGRKDKPSLVVSLDGLNSGVPTRTTSTLTPTLLRNIDQTFLDLQSEVEPYQNEAGFVPPVVQPITQGSYMSLVDQKGWQGGITSVAPSRPSTALHNPTIATVANTARRNVGGRRPAKNTGISPEEEERRRIRRERNKMAAARCRKRRMDHTNALLEQTEELEQKKQGLQNEIQQLQMAKEELELILETHKVCCRLRESGSPPSPPDVKPLILPPVVPEQREMKPPGPVADQERFFGAPPPAKRPAMSGGSATGGAKPPRPTSLPVAAAFTPMQNMLKTAAAMFEGAGLPGATPSANIPFNFDSLMEGGTGLTPVSSVSNPVVTPSCSSQQRSAGCVDLSSPDSVPPKLVSL